MDSFDPKPAQAELYATPMDPTIIGMPPCPRPAERMTEMTCGDLITTQESRGVNNNSHMKNTAMTVDGPRVIYLRFRQPGLTTSAGGCLMIMVDEVVDKATTNLQISYEEPDILTRTMGQTTMLQTTGGAMTSRRWE